MYYLPLLIFFIVICHFSQKKFDVFLNLMKKTLICNDIAIVSVEGNDYRLSNNVAINIMENLNI